MQSRRKIRRTHSFADTVRAHLAEMDLPCAVLAVALALYGIFVITSAVHTTMENYGIKYIVIQTVAVLLGVAGMAVVSALDYERWMKKLSVPLFLFTAAILAATLVIGTGEGSNKSWIRFDFLPIGIQPSEFAKIFFICTFAYHLASVRTKLHKLRNLLALCLHFGVICGLVLLQGDLGSALVFVFVFICMMFASGVKLRYFLLAAGAVLCASPFLWEHLSYYQKQRILVGFSPESDPQGFGYQVLRAKEAIANGGITGMGYLQGELSQNAAASALPKRHTDMIFAVMAEELGFVGVCVYLVLYVALVVRILWVAAHARGYMGSYICIGAAAVFIFQGLENIGMCMGLLPVIGLTLPFLSYGGSSALSLFLLVGVVESVAAHRVKYYTERDDLL
ncbi:MAG: rod shape-determining protein RodA [Clostridia bacterium]|nr:rod shape-determining protein RodA [Clostridia bacterium]